MFIITQGHPDEKMFADVFPRYERFMKWGGFAESHLIRACGITPTSEGEVDEHLPKAEALARTIMA